jgi:hypothetical protein
LVSAAPVTVLGTALTLGGLISAGMLAWPPGFGSADWELAAFGELAVTWAVVGLGCAALIVASATSSSNRGAGIASTVLLIVGAVAIGGAVLVLLNVPLVWRTQLPPAVLTQLKVATAKAAALNLVYGIGYFGIGVTVMHGVFSRRIKT